MCRFIETIQVRDGKLQNLAHHNRRMNETRQAVFGIADQLDILDYTGDCPESGFYKCRVVYGREVCEVAFSAYTMRGLYVRSGWSVRIRLIIATKVWTGRNWKHCMPCAAIRMMY